ncbi:uncharacterized protein LOC130813896 isoform X2 [Amaranthus tricolor]|uniref:uncharacterized protein LOC130813896 isoform X2 n=1 Tax=Amaranthus tricolor TaxID=29722 RepID=UPI00258DF685|nr:uncharacterized protein LOC130813896 isoform X2 [Amaranthus tricolor]
MVVEVEGRGWQCRECRGNGSPYLFGRTVVCVAISNAAVVASLRKHRCTEVRYKPKASEVEVDLSIDMNSDNFNSNANEHFKITKQTLSSSGWLPQTTQYTVGVVLGKKMYVNPIHEAVQLCPSMEYIDSAGSKKRNSNGAVKEGSSNGAIRLRQQSKKMDLEVEEGLKNMDVSMPSLPKADAGAITAVVAADAPSKSFTL